MHLKPKEVQKVREIKRIFIHCTAGHQYNYTDEFLVKLFKNKGWTNPGYHYVVRPDGTIFNMLPEDKVSNGVAGYNNTSINVTYVGGIERGTLKPIDNRTDAQKAGLIKLLQELRVKYPKAYIMGHREISPDKDGNGRIDPWEWVKSCPNFDASKEYEHLNLGLEKPKN